MEDAESTADIIRPPHQNSAGSIEVILDSQIVQYRKSMFDLGDVDLFRFDPSWPNLK